MEVDPLIGNRQHDDGMTAYISQHEARCKHSASGLSDAATTATMHDSSSRWAFTEEA